MFSPFYRGGMRLDEDMALRRTKLVGSGSLFSQYTQASPAGMQLLQAVSVRLPPEKHSHGRFTVRDLMQGIGLHGPGG